MAIGERDGLVTAQGLTQEELAEIKFLATSCTVYEQIDLKLNWSTLKARSASQTNDFLYYKQGVLVGYLAIFHFNSREAELSGMVHPEQRRNGIFTKLYQAAYSECQQREVQILLLIVERSSTSGQAFVQSLQPRYDHSEYKMVLGEAKLLERYDPQLRFRLSEPQDIPALTQITAQAFNLPETEVDWYLVQNVESTKPHYYVMELDTVVIGKLDVSVENDQAWIYGFGVEPAMRGRGYGRQLLAWTIQTCQAQGQSKIALEVAIENEHALGLYTSCGFKTMGCYDYFSLDLHKA